MKKAVKLKIKGIVQGIFFRSFMKDEADKLGLRGYARNLENGDVEAWFEGNNEEVEKMIELCKKGPKHSEIKEVVVEERKFEGFENFKILRM